MTSYPIVLSEQDTLNLVTAGHSLARYGDGEFKLCRGAGIKSQRFDPTLQERLRAILHDSGDCLVGIPNLRMKTKPFWDSYRGPATIGLLAARLYGSAFVSRPDSAPWVNIPGYWAQVEGLWKGRRVTLVRGSAKSLTPDRLQSASQVDEVLCPRQHAWAEYPALLRRIGVPARALLCCGPTATVMAVDLCARGVHAIDLGHIGMWWKRLHLSPLQALAEGRRDES